MITADQSGRAGSTKIRLIVVHGIGSQKAGSTAARWADSLVRFGRAAGYRPDVAATTLNSDPARVTVRFLTVVPFVPPPLEEIAIEEAHWAEAFPEPSVGRVLRFLATVAPVLAITQSIAIWRTRGKLWPAPQVTDARINQSTVDGTAPTPVPITAAATLQATGHIATMVAPLALGILVLGVAAPLIAVLLLVLLLGASLPIPAVRQAVGKALGWLTTSIGDAYLFVADPVNRAAMEHRLAERLREQSAVPPCRTVLLAHSQGAALAYRALNSVPEKIRPTALITMGSGVGRLHQVGLLQTLPWFLTPLFVVIVASAATGIALADPLLTTAFLALAFGLGFVAWRICARWLDRTEGQGRDLLKPITGMSWLDIWASFDPVPNGRTAKNEGLASYQLARVAGEQSLVRDHVRYDLDWDQTMPLVWSRLRDPSDKLPIDYVGVRPPVAGEEGPARLLRIPLTARDLWGLVLRSVPLGAVAIPLFAVDLFDLGHWLRTAPPGFLDSTIDTVFVPLRTVSEFLETTWVRAPRAQELLGFLALLTLGVAGSILTRRVLTFLQRRETTAWLSGGGAQSYPGAPRWNAWKWRRNFIWVALAAAAVPVFLLWGGQYFDGAGERRLEWTRAQTVEAYLTAVAEDDMHALCEITTADVTARPFGESGSPDPCTSDEKDALAAVRICEDGRKAVAALDEDAFKVDARGAVKIVWDPEVEGTCKNRDHWLALPTQVALEDGRWRISDVTDQPKK